MRGADLAAKQLGSEAAKVVDAKTPRCKEAKSVTEINFVNSGDEHESIVGWGCEIADEWLTRGARNEIHICGSNMNGSYEREAISRRYPNSEKSIQSHPSPEFLNSLSFIKKFYPLPFGARAKGRKGNHETEAIGRHSERLAKESSDTNLIQLQGIKINLTETDQASMPLGIFASKSASDVGIASWNYFSLVTAIHIAVADMNFVTRSPSCTLVRNSAMPTYFKNLAAWLPSRLAPKKSAFTLAEVLITLGIIGIVAALTLPTVIQNYQKQATVTKLKKAYSMLGQVAQKSIADNGAIDFVEGDLLDEGAVKKFFNTYWLSYFKGVDVFPDGKKPYLSLIHI